MVRTVIKNSIIVLSLIILGFISNYFYTDYMKEYRVEAFIVIIIFAGACGVGLALMDLSKKIINIALTILCLIVSIISSLFRIFAYGPTMYLFILMFGYLMVFTIKEVIAVKLRFIKLRNNGEGDTKAKTNEEETKS